MPPTIVMSNYSKRSTDFGSYNYDYTYPSDISLKPGTEDHDKIKKLILDSTHKSRLAMQNRFSSWNEMDRIMTTYITPTDEDVKIKAKDSRKPTYIIYPHSYAMMESLLTYMFLAFVQQPIWRYEGIDPSDTIGAMLLEMVVNLHCEKTKVPLALHTGFRDGFTYGIGVMSPGWRKVIGRRIRKSQFTTDTMQTEDSGFEEGVIFEGNELRNISPYYFLPDPNVSITEQHRGEFCGWLLRDNYLDLLRDEKNSTGLFNVQYLKHMQHKRSAYGNEESKLSERTGIGHDLIIGDNTNATDVIHMYHKLIPKEYKLSTSDKPELWKFTLAADEVIVEAYKEESLHNMYPVAVIAPDYDGYSVAPISKIETLYGLQGVIDWLLNTHITNVRKAVNDMWIVDPQLVNINDLKDPQPGKLIRLRRPAWGKGVKDVAMQMPVTDVTRANVQDSMFIAQLMEHVGGADASMAGALRKSGPERLTKAEFQGTRSGGVSRLERMAQVIGYQGMQDIGVQFAANAQEMMSEEVFVKVVGEWRDKLNQLYGTPVNRVKVTPKDINIMYDVLVRDGTIPGGNFSESQLRLFEIIAKDEELRGQFDMFRIFSQIAINSGFKNVEDFRRLQGGSAPQIGVMPDEAVLQQAQAGNLVPS